jgi:hypothetical protein
MIEVDVPGFPYPRKGRKGVSIIDHTYPTGKGMSMILLLVETPANISSRCNAAQHSTDNLASVS